MTQEGRTALACWMAGALMVGELDLTRANEKLCTMHEQGRLDEDEWLWVSEMVTELLSVRN